MRYLPARAMILIAGLAFAIAACTKPSGLDYVTVTPSSQSLTVGQTAQFTATGTFGNASRPTTGDVTSQVTWTSSAPAVATIATSGKATAVSVGTTTITASIQGYNGLKTATATLTVSGSSTPSTNIVSLTLMPSTLSVSVPGETAFVKAIGTDAAGNSRDLSNSGSLSWSSSNNLYATVAPCINDGQVYGCITGVSQSSVTIVAVYSNLDGTVATGTAAFLTVNSGKSNLSAITLYPNALSISKGASTQHVFATGTPSGGTSTYLLSSTTNPVWTSQNTAIATIASDGNGGQWVTGVNVGSTTVTVSYTNPGGTTLVQTLPVTVTAAAELGPLTAINIVPGDITVSNAGMSAQYLAFGTFNTGNVTQDLTDKVTWVTTQPMVATISATGIASAAGYTGNSVLYATYKNPNNDASSTGSTIFSNPQTFTCKSPSTSTCEAGLPTSQFVYLNVVVMDALTGDGHVSANVGGIDCAVSTGVCSAYYPVGTTVILTRKSTSSTFQGWSSGSNLVGGACKIPTGTTLANSPTCTITLNDYSVYDPTVGALFY